MVADWPAQPSDLYQQEFSASCKSMMDQPLIFINIVVFLNSLISGCYRGWSNDAKHATMRDGDGTWFRQLAIIPKKDCTVTRKHTYRERENLFLCTWGAQCSINNNVFFNMFFSDVEPRPLMTQCFLQSTLRRDPTNLNTKGKTTSLLMTSWMKHWW